MQAFVKGISMATLSDGGRADGRGCVARRTRSPEPSIGCQEARCEPGPPRDGRAGLSSKAAAPIGCDGAFNAARADSCASPSQCW
jgi:hypothetical protein